jgi:hypothetical protein
MVAQTSTGWAVIFALSLAGCAVAPHDVAPEPVDAGQFLTWNCGDLRYALYDAELYIKWSSHGGLETAWSEAINRNASMTLGSPQELPIVLALLPVWGASGQQGAVAALAHAKGKAAALQRAMREKACTEWQPGTGREVVRYGCALRIRDPAWGDSGQFIPSESGGSLVRLVLFERAIQFWDVLEHSPSVESITPAQLLDIPRSSLPDAAGEIALVYRATYPTGVGVAFRDRYQLRADDCGPMPEAGIAGGRAVLHSWFESLLR